MSSKSAKSAKSSMSAKPTLLETPRSRAIAWAVSFVAAAAFIVIARSQPSQPQSAAPGVHASNAVPDMSQPSATASATQATPAVTRVPGVRSNTPAPVSKATARASEPTRAASTAAVSTQETYAITITGCLERDEDKFRLKNTVGENAPQSRSWKAGFLKRRNRSVEIVDTLNRFKLADHVGERVTATGLLVDGDIQLRSMRRVATSCEKEA